MGQRVFGVPRREREEGEIGLRGRGDVLPHALKRRGRGGGHHRGLGGGYLRGRGCVFRRRERRRAERAERGVRRRPPRRDGRAVFAFAHARAGRGGPVRVGGLRRFRAVQPVRPRGHVLGRARGGGARRVQARLSGRGGDSVERASRRGAQRGALRGLERLAGGDRLRARALLRAAQPRGGGRVRREQPRPFVARARDRERRGGAGGDRREGSRD
mmetsp:Transcript_5631/g.23859  ORF Transcript_5631/g.23859 Transcript_5631/m.23859 type:complete len:215 (+) Transcript_5631:572-1216(+)